MRLPGPSARGHRGRSHGRRFGHTLRDGAPKKSEASKPLRVVTATRRFLAACRPGESRQSRDLMGGKTRERLWGDRVRAARIHAEHARKTAADATREADAAECMLWSAQMEGFGGPAQPSPTIGQALNGGFGFLEVQCKRCETRTSIPL